MHLHIYKSSPIITPLDFHCIIYNKMERNSYTSLRAGNSAIILDRAKDSHKFFSEGTAYFHVNFKAGAGQHGPN